MFLHTQSHQGAAPSDPVVPGWGPSYGAVQEVDWQVVDEGRYVLVLTSAARDARNKTNVNGALGAVAHHIRRTAHCGLEEGADDRDRCLSNGVHTLQCRQPVGVIIQVPQAPFKGQEALFSSAMGAQAKRVQTSTEAWRCKTDSRVQEALASLTGIPIVTHGFVITITAFLLATFLPPLANVKSIEKKTQVPEQYARNGAGDDGNHDGECNSLGGNGWKTREAKRRFQKLKFHEMKETLRTLGACV